MKSCIKGLSIMVIMVLFFGCSKDEENNVTLQVVKTKVSITKIDVTSIPQFTPNAGNWDSSTNNPDLYIKCYDELGNLIVTSSTLWNFFPSVSNAFTVNFASPISTTDLTNSVLKVQTWDDDSDNINPDDKIGEVPFYIYNYTIGANKYPSYVVKSDGIGTVVTIYMTWE